MFSKLCGEFGALAPGRQVAVVVAGAGGLALLSYGAYRLKRRLDNTPPKTWRKAGEITELLLYPIKSCGPVVVRQIDCAELGPQQHLLRDRTFMVTNADGKFVTARMKPKMVLIQPRFDDRYETMVLTAPGVSELRIDVARLTAQTPVASSVVWGETVPTVDCGDDVARWFSQFLLGKDAGYRLRYYPLDRTSRRIEGADSGSFPDVTSYMLFNDASVDDLNRRLEKKVTPLQFRPNFVVRGPAAYAEDNWRWVRIGDAVFKYVRPCLRCIFTTIDPAVGEPHPAKEPLATLKSYRQIPSLGESPALGIHLGLRRPGTVKLGDPVYYG